MRVTKKKVEKCSQSRRGADTLLNNRIIETTDGHRNSTRLLSQTKKKKEKKRKKKQLTSRSLQDIVSPRSNLNGHRLVLYEEHILCRERSVAARRYVCFHTLFFMIRRRKLLLRGFFPFCFFSILNWKV